MVCNEVNFSFVSYCQKSKIMQNQNTIVFQTDKQTNKQTNSKKATIQKKGDLSKNHINLSSKEMIR